MNKIVNITINPQSIIGPLELWRHAIGHGGINAQPLPDRVINGVAKLHPQWLRIFIQEFFNVYPDHDRLDWRKLDPYMEVLARTGAKVVAAITIKPELLYPEINHAIWRPNNVQEWQYVIRELVRRFSIKKPIVTHWEIGNEVDIGEAGGSPYLIQDPQAYAEYYTMTAQAILEVFPRAKIGGPASANLLAEPMPGFVTCCQQAGTPLDFVSWHLYHSDMARHKQLIESARAMTAKLPEKPELMVTEWSPYPAAWNPGEHADSTEERAFDVERSAVTAAVIIKMLNAGLDGSFYYHLWDQVCDPADFAPFFSEQGVANMVHHWNEFPHRLGLFGVNQEVRPQYFVFRMLSQLGEEQIESHASDRAVLTLAGRDGHSVNVLAVNHSMDSTRDCIATLEFANLSPGKKQLVVYRIDTLRQWDCAALELRPLELRETFTLQNFTCQINLPANSVALVQLHESDRLPTEQHLGQ